VFRVFGILTRGSFFAVFFLNALFSSAVCIAMFHAGKRIGGIGVASGAAWLWALFPNAVMVPFEWVWDTSLTTLLGATIFWATLKLAESQRVRDWCGYGLLWGFTLMTNPALGSLLPFLLGWAAYRARREMKMRITRQVLAAAGIAFLCCVPWTVRNYVQFHRLVPLRSNFPLELYIGNNNNYATRQFVWPPKITKEMELLRYFKLGETGFIDEEKRKAMEFIRAHPGIFLELTWDRIVTFWTGLPAPVESFIHAETQLVRVLLVCNALAGLGGLVGIVVLTLRRSPYAFPAAAYPVVFPWLYYITHPNLRYRHPIDPVVLLLAALAIGSLLGFRPATAESSSGPEER
jgi:4-amino-4-deoxy-L-arabinose transferase-like glycosyltransferase